MTGVQTRFTPERAALTAQRRAFTYCGRVQVDNLVIHQVSNTATRSRVHLVIDVAEHAAPERWPLQAGQICRYTKNMQSESFTDGC